MTKLPFPPLFINPDTLSPLTSPFNYFPPISLFLLSLSLTLHLPPPHQPPERIMMAIVYGVEEESEELEDEAQMK